MLVAFDGLLGEEINLEREGRAVHVLIGNFDSPAARISQGSLLSRVADQNTPRHEGILLNIHGTRFVVEPRIIDLQFVRKRSNYVAIIPDV